MTGDSIDLLAELSWRGLIQEASGGLEARLRRGPGQRLHRLRRERVLARPSAISSRCSCSRTSSAPAGARCSSSAAGTGMIGRPVREVERAEAARRRDDQLQRCRAAAAARAVRRVRGRAVSGGDGRQPGVARALLDHRLPARRRGSTSRSTTCSARSPCSNGSRAGCRSPSSAT
jgi:hypothetical protein